MMGTYSCVIGTGGEYTTLAGFRTQAYDLTGGTSTIAMASHSSNNGLVVGDAVRKASNNAVTATVQLINSSQILLRSISGGTFSSGDTVEKSSDTSKNCVLTSNQDTTIVLEAKLKAETFNEKGEFAAWGSNATSYLHVKPDTGAHHGGDVTAGAKIHYDPVGDTYEFGVDMGGYQKLTGINIRTKRTSGDHWASAVRLNGSDSARSYMYQCLVKAEVTGGGGGAFGVICADPEIYSSLIYECSANGIQNDGEYCNFKIYGCTIVDCGGYAVRANANYCDALIVGTIGYSNTSGFLQGTEATGCGYNASELATSAQPGGSSANNVQVSSTIGDVFTTPGSDVYTLNSLATTIHTAWTGTVPSGATPDCAGVSRPSGADESIGAFEYINTASTSSYTPILNVKYKFTHNLVR
jgi:hypothetical protein